MSAARTTGRNVAEWVTFGVASAIIALVAGLMVVQSFGSSDPPAPVAERVGAVRDEGGHFFVPVDVTNRGDETAAAVQVIAELTVDGETTSGDQVIDFLGGSEVVHLTFAFDTDPSAGELVVSVTGFSDP